MMPAIGQLEGYSITPDHLGLAAQATGLLMPPEAIASRRLLTEVIALLDEDLLELGTGEGTSSDVRRTDAGDRSSDVLPARRLLSGRGGFDGFGIVHGCHGSAKGRDLHGPLRFHCGAEVPAEAGPQPVGSGLLQHEIDRTELAYQWCPGMSEHRPPSRP
jgi:hypothetical protein